MPRSNDIELGSDCGKCEVAISLNMMKIKCDPCCYLTSHDLSKYEVKVVTEAKPSKDFTQCLIEEVTL